MEPLDIIDFVTWEVNWIRKISKEQITSRKPNVYSIKSTLPLFRPLALNKAINTLIYTKRVNRIDVQKSLEKIYTCVTEIITLWNDELSKIDKFRVDPDAGTEVSVASIEIYSTPSDPWVVSKCDFSEVHGKFLNYRLIKYCSTVRRAIEDLDQLPTYRSDSLSELFKEDYFSEVHRFFVECGVIKDGKVVKKRPTIEVHALYDELTKDPFFLLESLYEKTLNGWVVSVSREVYRKAITEYLALEKEIPSQFRKYKKEIESKAAKKNKRDESKSKLSDAYLKACKIASDIISAQH